MIIKPYSQEYFFQLRNLRNSPEVGAVSNREYVKSLDLFLELSENDYRVALINGSVVGYVGIRGENNEVSIAVHKDFYRRGIASRLLEHIIKDYAYLTAEIKEGNNKSVYLFQKHGFRKDGELYKLEAWE